MIQNLLILICSLLIVVLLLTGVVALGLWLVLIIIHLLLIVLVLVITLVIVILPKNEKISHSLFIRSILICSERNHAVLKAPITLIVGLLGHNLNRHSI